MRKIFAIIGAVYGLMGVGIILLLEALLQIIKPDFTMPFNIWWGVLPGLAVFLIGCCLYAFYGDRK